MNTRSRVRQACQISSVIEQPVSEYDDNESESEDEDFVESESAHESEEDADSDDELEQEAAAAPPSKKRRGRICYLRSKSGFKWSQNTPDPRGRRSLVEHTATPKGDALNVTTPLEAWSVLFTEEIINIILIHTNEEINRHVAKMKANGEHVGTYQKSVDLVELKAFLVPAANQLTISTLRTTLRLQIEALVDEKDIPEDEYSRNLLGGNKMAKQKRCSFCPLALDRKTHYKCLRCQLPMCLEHVAKVCCNCFLKMQT